MEPGMDFTIEHGILSWKIENFYLLLAPGNYTTESSTFRFASATWFFRLVVKHRDGKVYISVELCRSVNDDKPDNVTAEYMLSVKFMNQVIAVNENEYDFVKGDFFTVIQFESDAIKFLNYFGCNENDDELVIECIICTLLTRHCNYWESDIRPDMESLSDDLRKLLFSHEFQNAYLVTEGTDIPVLVEILSSHSCIFREQLSKSLSTVRKFHIPFSRDVVKAMLEFLYTGQCREALYSHSFKLRKYLDLYRCAKGYKISELLKHFTFWKIQKVTAVKYQNANFLLRLPNWKNISHSKPHFWKRIYEDIEVTLNLDTDVSKKMLLFQVRLKRCRGSKPLSVSMIFSVLDTNYTETYKKQRLLCLTCKEDDSSVFLVQERNFSSDVLVLPNDIIIRCDFKFGHLDEFCVSSDVEYLSNAEDVEDSNTSRLSENMEKIHLAGSFHNVRLGVGLNSILHAHRSILCARCPELVRLLPVNGDQLYLNIPLDVAIELVFYIYTGRLLESDTFTDFESLYSVARRYKFSSLQARCQKLMKSYSSDKNTSQNSSR